MKIINKYYLKLLIITFFVAPLLTSCAGSSPTILSEYKKPLPKTNLSQQEKKDIFHRYVPRPCTEEEIKIRFTGVQSNNKICYSVDDSFIIRKNFSKSYDYGAILKGRFVSSGYPYYSDRFLSKLKATEDHLNKFDIEVLKVHDFKQKVFPSLNNKQEKVSKLYSEYNDDFVLWARNIQILIKNRNGILPENIVDGFVQGMRIKKSVRDISKNTAYDFYLNKNLEKILDETLRNPSRLKNNFYLHIDSTLEYFGKYRVMLRNKNKSASFADAPKAVSFTPYKIMHDFIPSKFNAANKDIKARLSGNKLTLTNIRKNFIEINTLSIYYNGDIYTKDKQVILPPDSKTTLDLINYKPFQKPYIKVTSPLQEVSFGLAVNYKVTDKDKSGSLYKNIIQKVN